jgi:hypothetical protein
MIAFAQLVRTPLRSCCIIYVSEYAVAARESRYGGGWFTQFVTVLQSCPCFDNRSHDSVAYCAGSDEEALLAVLCKNCYGAGVDLLCIFGER